MLEPITTASHADATRKPIGGFFELETPLAKSSWHEGALELSTGRACLLVYLQHTRPARAFLPEYTCDATFEPFLQVGVPVSTYRLDRQFRPVNLPDLKANDCVLITNYWGMQRSYVRSLGNRIGRQMIVDNTHDFHWKCNGMSFWSFTSARKWFGVPDGAYLYPPQGTEASELRQWIEKENQHVSVEHGMLRLLGEQQLAFQKYQQFEAAIRSEASSMSRFSRSLLSHIDFNETAQQRKQNYRFLHHKLGSRNRLELGLCQSDPVLFAYPYLPAVQLQRSNMHDAGVFVPQLWRDVLDRSPAADSLAAICSERLLPLPVDHRYNTRDMQRIVDVIDALESA